MSICIARFCKTVTPLMRSCLYCPAKRCVFKSRLKRSDSTARSRNESSSEFQTVGPATAKARVPNALPRNRCIFSLRRLAERRCWRPETSETDTQQSASTLELSTETPLSSHGAWARLGLLCLLSVTQRRCSSSRVV